jgi:hypothetical protein
MTELCHICKEPEDQPGLDICSSGVHPRPSIIWTPTQPKTLTPAERHKMQKDMMDAEYAIFFDIDGCFHPQGAAKHTRNGEIHPSSDPLFIWAEGFLEIIKPYHNVALVCHSLWRLMMTDGGVYWSLPELMQERFLTCTRESDRYGSIVKTATDFGFKEYIIIDDSPGEFPKKLPNFVECDSSVGLSSTAALANLKHLMLKLFGPPPAPIEA